jgi:predicted dehydrogenase
MLGTVEFAGGCTVMLSASAADPPGASAVIRGSLASLEVWPDAVRITPERPGARAETVRADAYAPSLLEGWLAAIRGGGTGICGPDTALATQQALVMAREAWRTGRTVAA